jgi:chitinase
VQQLTTHLSGRQAVCDKETLAFGYSGQAVVGLYAGPALQKQRIPKQALEQLQVTMQSGNELSDEMYFQLCAPEQLSSRYAMGIAISTKGDLNVVQAAAQTWKNGSCISTYDQISDWLEFQYSIPTASTRNSTVRRSHLSRETTCSTTQAWPGDTHDSLAAECGITTAEFTQYNPSKSLHSSFEAGEHVCCSTGRLANVSPSPYSNGTCATYIVQMGDTCSDLAAANGITIELIEGYNKETWAWLGCGDLQAGKSMCLSTGNPPMPAPIANAVCGPQVPGTPVAPYGTDLTKLNACPLSACCNFWGQCGITDDFCTKTDSPTGAPGTSNCISYCGNEIMFGPPPGEFLKIAYFEGYDVSRPCLRMAVTNIDTSAYTHIHMSFATLNEDFSVDISSIEEQFRLFVQMTGIKRIISFGGWEFSTSAASYMIFRDAVNAANRQTFVDSVISFLNEYDLDGVDFDWEYPGAPDIPDIPASTEEDANNFFLFLNLLSTNMSKNAPGKTLAVTAPSSYWYLKTMPIIPISVVVDYIVYMTYDLHGQWDYDNAWADSGCSAGNCLRSHVNLTETLNAMSMITKAGIPSNKVIIGVSSYGRSFQMTTPGCYGPMCTYTGPESGARKGACTGTAGYLADGEIEQVLRANSSVSVHELDDSFSNILVYDETQWVAYMDADNKGTRTALYAMYNFGGIADWAVDLQSSSGSGGDNDDDSSSSGDGETGEEIYIDPGLWTSSDPVIVCSPPCTFVLPPVPLETTTSITWTSYTTSFQSSKSGTIHTVTSTYSLPPFPVSSISLWPVTVKEGDPKTAPVIPMPSINPPPLVVPLPPGVQPFPPAHFPSANPDVTTTKPTTKPTSTATTTTGDHSNSGSSSSTSRPIYFPTTSHSVTLRPQPTISISWPPPITIPTATYSSGSIARPTNTPGCKGCGAIECIFFGCGGGCGLLACDGGCGVFGCGGGCGLGDCPGNCPLERCGGGGCRDGSCGNSGCADGNCGPSTCETTLTATNCIEYCTVITAAAGAIPTTDCTSTTCFPTTGCQATDTTETITSTSDDACPSPTPITTYPLSEDPYGGCQPCSAAYINWGDPEMEVANDMLRIRGLMGPVGDRRQLEKRATAETFATVATNCALPTPVTMAEYTNVVDYLATAIAGNLPASQDMSRWYSKTVQDCVPTVTTVSDAAIQKNQKDTNQKGTMEHVCKFLPSTRPFRDCNVYACLQPIFYFCRRKELAERVLELVNGTSRHRGWRMDVQTVY